MADYYASLDTTNWVPGTRYFTKVSAVDHAGWLYIVTLMSFAYVGIAVVIRFIVKYGAYGADDWALLGSAFLALMQYVTVLSGLSKGLGLGLSAIGVAGIPRLQKYAAAHAYLHILAHCGSKLSSAILTQRLFENGRLRNTYFCWGLIASSALYGIASVMTLSIECSNPYNVFQPHKCPYLFNRWEAIMALDITTETLLIIIPLILLYDIQIKQGAKITVITVFAVRIMDVFFAAFNLHLIARLRHSTDPALGVVPNLIWTQTELLWSIMAASLPCLKTFMRPFDKIDDKPWRSDENMFSGGGGGGGTGNGTGARASRRRTWDELDDDVPLEDLKRQKDGVANNKRRTGEGSLELRPERISHHVVISGADTISDESRKSWGSQERIIKAHTDLAITSERRGRDHYEIP